MSIKTLKSSVILTAFTVCLCAAAYSAVSTSGPEFWVMFNMQHMDGDGDMPVQEFAITSGTSAAGVVQIPGTGFSQNFTVTPGSITVINLPANTHISTLDGTQSKAVHITADSDIVVYGLNRRAHTTDGYLALPVGALGYEYYAMSYYSDPNTANPGWPTYWGSQFGIAAAHDNTTVTIIPSVTIGARQAGIPYTVTLNRGDAYQLMDAGFNDLTGTFISADKPIAVFSGHRCARIPITVPACDHITEQLLPVHAWGREFITAPLAGRTSGDTFRIMASEDNTTVMINGVHAATINKGQFYQVIITNPSYITSTNPLLVMQYANSAHYDPSAFGDPFMSIVFPLESFSSDYHTASYRLHDTPDPAYLNITAPISALGSVSVNGTLLGAGIFAPVPGTPYYYTQLAVPAGPAAYNVTAFEPFGLSVYGFYQYDSYGYPAGGFLPPMPTQTSTPTLTPTSTITPTLTATPTITPEPEIAELTIQKKVAGNSTAQGTEITYTVTLYNDSKYPAYNINIWDTLPGALTFVSGITHQPASVDGNYILWELTGITLSPGETLFLEFSALISGETGGNVISNTAGADYNDGYYTPDYMRHPPIFSDAALYPGSAVAVFPNPYSINGPPLKISNLIPGSTVSFYTLSGEFVYSIKAQCVTESWNGTNRRGARVSPGVYYYLIINPSGGVTEKGKIFIVR
ncbi:MAG TPA: isopeptide-forming domain-containing fimbrial protein [bacterium]|nr:isopeptide-forming domain-containing fimbrial protein [bacterium]